MISSSNRRKGGRLVCLERIIPGKNLEAFGKGGGGSVSEELSQGKILRPLDMRFGLHFGRNIGYMEAISKN